MDEQKKKWIETTIVWVGYSVVVIGALALLLILLRTSVEGRSLYRIVIEGLQGKSHGESGEQPRRGLTSSDIPAVPGW